MPAILKTRYDMMAYMHKCIMVSRAHDFMTSDAPVVWVDPVRFPPHPIYGFNFLHLSNEVVYPLTPRHCILMSYLPLVPLMEANADQVTTVNARLARYSVNEMYTHPTQSRSEQLQFVLDIAGEDQFVKRPLIMSSIDRRDGGQIYLRLVADALKTPWEEVVKENIDLVEGWRERGFIDIVLDQPGPATADAAVERT
jgi:hypothetical protein